MQRQIGQTRRGFLIFGSALLGVAAGAETTKSKLAVQVTYTGKGAVDAGHKIYVFLWDTSDFNKERSGIRPLAVKSVTANSAVVEFDGIKKSPVFLSMVYDGGGKWQGKNQAPEGSAMGLYMSEPGIPAPIQLKPGETTKVTATFDDTSKQKGPGSADQR